MKLLCCGLLTWAAAQDAGVSLLQFAASKRARADPIGLTPPDVDPSGADSFVDPPLRASPDLRDATAASGAIAGAHDLQFTDVSVNNLRGLGPESTAEAVLRYKTCTQKAGRPVDCVVTASRGYKAAVPEKNGVYGRLGNINLKNGRTGTFTISFVDAESSDPVQLDEFFFSIFDIDTGSGWFTNGTVRPTENLQITGYRDMYHVPRDNHGELEKKNDTFTSTVHGWESSNPTNPFILTKQQVERSVQFIFPANMTSLSFTYRNDVATNMTEGRNVLFGGMSSLFLCKTKKLDIEFDNSVVKRNNLGNMGPEFGAKEGILYENIASVGEQVIDLEINAITDYTVYNTSRNGKNGYYGQINIQTGTSTDFRFKLLVHGTQEPYTADWLYFSLFDLDHNREPHLWEEFMTMSNFSTYSLTDHTTVDVTDLGGGAYTFKSTIRGVGADNPDDPMRLTQVQMSKNVAFVFHKTSAFTVNYKVGPPGLKILKKVPDGRNFLFAGKSSNDACGLNTYEDVENDPRPHNHWQKNPHYDDAGGQEVRVEQEAKRRAEEEEEEAIKSGEDADPLEDAAEEAEDEKVDENGEAVFENAEAKELAEEAKVLEEKAESVADREQAAEMKGQAEEMEADAEALEDQASTEEADAVKEKTEPMEEEAKRLEAAAAEAEDNEEAEDLKAEAEVLKDEAEQIREDADDLE